MTRSWVTASLCRCPKRDVCFQYDDCVNPLNFLRETKHHAFVASKHVRWFVRDRYYDAQRAYSKACGFTYVPSRYERHFGALDEQSAPTSSTFPIDHLRFASTLPSTEGERVPRRLYVLWTGYNDLTPNRASSVEVIKSNNPDVSFEFITPANVSDYVVEDYPLHPAYEQLSSVHKSDYLRAYLMYHHGGAYLDIKPYNGRVSDFFDVLDAEPRIWAVGSREASGNSSPAFGGKLGKDQKLHTSRILSQACFAFRPHTDFAGQWLAECERRLDYFQDLLNQNPAVDPRGTSGGYPVPWFSLLGAVFSPLALKYHDRIRISDSVQVTLGGFVSYR